MQDYPSNCADSIKATQKLLIIDCSETADTLLLKRWDMSALAATELVSSTVAYSSNALAVIEIGDFGDNAFNQQTSIESSKNWMNEVEDIS